MSYPTNTSMLCVAYALENATWELLIDLGNWRMLHHFLGTLSHKESHKIRICSPYKMQFTLSRTCFHISNNWLQTMDWMFYM